MKIEEWRMIPGYEGLYMVSNFGRVKTVKTGYIHKGDIDCWGYHRVQLTKNGVKKHIKRSVLVAIAFLPNPNNLPEVDHIDEDKSNNCVWNLRWVSSKTNCNSGTRNKRISESKYKPVEMCDMNWNHICFFNSVKEASEKTGAKPNSISNNCRGESNSVLVNGVKHRFRYIQETGNGLV